MTRLVQYVVRALRVAAAWLLLVAIVLGPAGLGGAGALAADSEPCAMSCPCDAAVHGDAEVPGDADAHGAVSADAKQLSAGESSAGESSAGEPSAKTSSGDLAQGERDPCRDGCPADCPDCHCGAVGIAMAIVPIPVMTPSAVMICTTTCMPGPVEAHSEGTRPGVFRPPRSLS